MTTPLNPAAYIPPPKWPGEVYKVGSADDEVKMIKVRLNTLDIVDTPLDINNPFFGNTTEDAVKKFQKQKCLNADGEVGRLTWDKLFSPDAVLSFPPRIDETEVARRAVQIALDHKYVREKTGKNDGADVKAILASVGLPEGYSWCMAFVYYCFQIAANQLGVKNPCIKTAGVLDHWNRTRGAKVHTPAAGDVFVMDFGKGQGHTGIVVKADRDTIHTIEGNTSGQPTSASQDREGQGVYERIRKISSINKGFIRYS